MPTPPKVNTPAWLSRLVAASTAGSAKATALTSIKPSKIPCFIPASNLLMKVERRAAVCMHRIFDGTRTRSKTNAGVYAPARLTTITSYQLLITSYCLHVLLQRHELVALFLQLGDQSFQLRHGAGQFVENEHVVIQAVLLARLDLVHHALGQ